MKRSWRGIGLLGFLLLGNIVFTQQTVNHYYYEKYEMTIVYAILNILIFPLSYLIYEKEVKRR